MKNFGYRTGQFQGDYNPENDGTPWTVFRIDFNR